MFTEVEDRNLIRKLYISIYGRSKIIFLPIKLFLFNYFLLPIILSRYPHIFISHQIIPIQLFNPSYKIINKSIYIYFFLSIKLLRNLRTCMQTHAYFFACYKIINKSTNNVYIKSFPIQILYIY